MKTIYESESTPKKDGFYMPGEYEEQERTWILWPHRSDVWRCGAKPAQKVFTEIIKTVARFQPITVGVNTEDFPAVCEIFDGVENVRVIHMEYNDSWIRDPGPAFLVNDNGEVALSHFHFNAYGGFIDGLYFPWDKDDKMARKLCDLFDVDMYDMSGFVLEGGSIHTDGEGTLITTEACLLSKGRNPKLTKAEIEEKLAECLGITKVIWLKNGIFHDETDEHVDNICAFVKPGEVVLAWTDDENDPQYALSKSCLDILENSTDAKGRKIKVHKLYLPKPIYVTEEECGGLDTMDFEPTRTVGERLAASYVNFYIANKAIVMPFFGDENDERAKKTLAELFPEREIIPIYARDILTGGGNIHCITQQIPAVK